MYSVGGAGALFEIGEKIAHSLKHEIQSGEINLILAAGVKKFVIHAYKKLEKEFQTPNLQVVSGNTLDEYFSNFNQAIRKTDILWTKPGELSFYCSLGLPIIIAPPIGSQEVFNKDWILKVGGGIAQPDLKHIKSWLFHHIQHGTFAKLAINGFENSPKNGLFNMLHVIENNLKEQQNEN